jgi:CRISPR-associated protein Cmr3
MQKMLPSKYFITLRPLTPFFFGGENTFGEGAEANFFVRSNYLPQQTTLLGFLRYELLQQNKLIGTNPAQHNWQELIGRSSFCMQDGKFTDDFGAIKKISPVFLSNGTEHYVCQSFDWTMDEIETSDEGKKEKLFPLEYAGSSFEGSCNAGKMLEKIPAFKADGKDFSQKNGTKPLWINASGKRIKQWSHEREFETGRGFDNGFFIEESQVGIYRQTKRTKADTGDFYTIISYRLADNFAFAFFADIELPEEKTFGSRLVTMGGERSVFDMKVKPADAGFEELFTSNTFNEGRNDNRKAIVLTSDVYTTDDMMDLCDFAIIETTPFRNIATVQQDKGDYIRIRGGAISKSAELLYLLKRGSIFFADDCSRLKQSFTHNAFHTIGYNHFIEL